MALAENLNRAIQDGNEALVKKLIQDGAAMDHLLGMRGTALCAALSAKQSSIATYLIDAGCGVNVEDYDREPPLYLAISKQCFDVVKKLLRHPKCQLNKPDPLTGTPPLCLAVACGFDDVVKWFIDAKADVNIKSSSDNVTPLHCAIAKQHYVIVDALVRAGCDLFIHDNDGYLPIHSAARNNDVIVLHSLLSKWVNLETDFDDTEINKTMSLLKDESKYNVLSLLNFKSKVLNRTPLDAALLKGHVKFASLLIKYGANPNTKDECNLATPLCVASYHFCLGQCDITLIRRLLEAGANVNTSSVGHRLNVDKSGYRDGREETPIMFAAKENSLPLLHVLREFKADVNKQNITRGPAVCKTPLTYAFENAAFDAAKYFITGCKEMDLNLDMPNIIKALSPVNHPDVSDLLDLVVDHGCPVDTEDSRLLTEAIFDQNANLVKCLIRHGVNMNSSSVNSVLPMQACAEIGDIEIARILLSSGADINVKNDNGVTPLRTSLDYSDEAHIELCYFLLESQADISDDLLTYIEDRQSYHNPDVTSDTDSDSGSSASLVDSDLPEAFLEDPNLLRVLKKLASGPSSLFNLCVKSIRNYIVKNNMAFSVLEMMPIPKKFIDIIAYRV